jgi:CRP/FNR family cyclic AMP-dependent transcriptional regulator
MVKESLLEVLASHPFVEQFEPAHIDKLAALAREVHFERDQVIFHEGDQCPDFFLILAGRVALEMEVPGHTLRVQTLSAGDELGWSAILVGKRKHFQARALLPVDALAFDAAALLGACRADTGFGFALMHRTLGVVSQRLQATRLQLFDMYSPVAKRAGN